MRQVLGAMTNSVVIVWAIVLLRCFDDVRFPAALFVAVIGLALIVQLLKRVGLALTRIIMALALIVGAVAAIADPGFRSRLVEFLNDILIFDCPHMIVYATFYTFGYAVLRMTRPSVQNSA
jgi:hypothetical protein